MGMSTLNNYTTYINEVTTLKNDCSVSFLNTYANSKNQSERPTMAFSNDSVSYEYDFMEPRKSNSKNGKESTSGKGRVLTLVYKFS